MKSNIVSLLFYGLTSAMDWSSLHILMHTTWTLKDFLVMFIVYVILPIYLKAVTVESIDETIASVLDENISKQKAILILTKKTLQGIWLLVSITVGIFTSSLCWCYHSLQWMVETEKLTIQRLQRNMDRIVIYFCSLLKQPAKYMCSFLFILLAYVIIAIRSIFSVANFLGNLFFFLQKERVFCPTIRWSIVAIATILKTVCLWILWILSWISYATLKSLKLTNEDLNVQDYVNKEDFKLDADLVQCLDNHLLDIPKSLDDQGYTLSETKASSIIESVIVCLAQSATQNYDIETLEEAGKGLEKHVQSERLKWNFQSQRKSLAQIFSFVSGIKAEYNPFPTYVICWTIKGNFIFKEFSGQADPADPVLLWQDPKTYMFHTVIPLRKSFHNEETYRFEIFYLSKSVLKRAMVKSGSIPNELLATWRKNLDDLTPPEFVEKLKNVQKISTKELSLMHALPQSYEAFRQEMLSQLNEVFQEICSEQEEAWIQKRVASANERQRMATQHLEEEAELEKLKKDIIEHEKKLETDKLLLSKRKKECKETLGKFTKAQEKKCQMESLIKETELEFDHKLKGLERSERQFQAQVQLQREQLSNNSYKHELLKWKLDSSYENLESIMSNSEDLKRLIGSQQSNICDLQSKEYHVGREQQHIRRNIADANDAIEDITSEIENASRKIDEKRREIESLELKCAWKKFEVQLNNWIPSYDLVKEGNQNELFSYNSELILKYFSNLDSARNPFLKKYVDQYRTDFLVKTRAILSDMVKPPTWEKFNRGSIGAWTGKSIRLRSLNHQRYREDEIQVRAEKVIYIDCNWELPGTNLILCAPNIIALNKPLIDTSGSDASEFNRKKAADGAHQGQSGSDGRDGEAGESAGNVAITCEKMSGRVRVKANGGNGADGQDGGDGRSGTSGRDGNSYPVSHEAPKEPNRLLGNLTVKVENLGQSGTPGTAGGCGGNAGTGGQGGFRGRVDLQIESGEHDVEVTNRDGSDGRDGKPGKGGSGGSGGKHGIDYAWVFVPEKSSLIWSGTWWRISGNYSLSSKYATYGFGTKTICLGYEYEFKGSKGYANSGKIGQTGCKARQSNQNKATAKKNLSTVRLNNSTSSHESMSAERKQAHFKEQEIQELLTEKRKWESQCKNQQDQLKKLDSKDKSVQKEIHSIATNKVLTKERLQKMEKSLKHNETEAGLQSKEVQALEQKLQKSFDLVTIQNKNLEKTKRCLESVTQEKSNVKKLQKDVLSDKNQTLMLAKEDYYSKLKSAKLAEQQMSRAEINLMQTKLTIQNGNTRAKSLEQDLAKLSSNFAQKMKEDEQFERELHHIRQVRNEGIHLMEAKTETRQNVHRIHTLEDHETRGLKSAKRKKRDDGLSTFPMGENSSSYLIMSQLEGKIKLTFTNNTKKLRKLLGLLQQLICLNPTIDDWAVLKSLCLEEPQKFDLERVLECFVEDVVLCHHLESLPREQTDKILCLASSKTLIEALFKIRQKLLTLDDIGQLERIIESPISNELTTLAVIKMSEFLQHELKLGKTFCDSVSLEKNILFLLKRCPVKVTFKSLFELLRTELKIRQEDQRWTEIIRTLLLKVFSVKSFQDFFCSQQKLEHLRFYVSMIWLNKNELLELRRFCDKSKDDDTSSLLGEILATSVRDCLESIIRKLTGLGFSGKELEILQLAMNSPDYFSRPEQIQLCSDLMANTEKNNGEKARKIILNIESFIKQILDLKKVGGFNFVKTLEGILSDASNQAFTNCSLNIGTSLLDISDKLLRIHPEVMFTQENADTVTRLLCSKTSQGALNKNLLTLKSLHRTWLLNHLNLSQKELDSNVNLRTMAEIKARVCESWHVEITRGKEDLIGGPVDALSKMIISIGKISFLSSKFFPSDQAAAFWKVVEEKPVSSLSHSLMLKELESRVSKPLQICSLEKAVVDALNYLKNTNDLNEEEFSLQMEKVYESACLAGEENDLQPIEACLQEFSEFQKGKSNIPEKVSSLFIETIGNVVKVLASDTCIIEILEKKTSENWMALKSTQKSVFADLTNCTGLLSNASNINLKTQDFLEKAIFLFAKLLKSSSLSSVSDNSREIINGLISQLCKVANISSVVLNAGLVSLLIKSSVDSKFPEVCLMAARLLVKALKEISLKTVCEWSSTLLEGEFCDKSLNSAWTSHLVSLQQAIIQKCKMETDAVVQERLDHLTSAVAFLYSKEVDQNNYLIRGFCRASLDKCKSSKEWMRETLDLKRESNRHKILNFLYSQNDCSAYEGVFLRQFLKLPLIDEAKTLDVLELINCDPSKFANTNRFAVIGIDLITNREFLLDTVGMSEAIKTFDQECPSFYQYSLEKKALTKVICDIVSLYFPLTNDLVKLIGKPKFNREGSSENYKPVEKLLEVLKKFETLSKLSSVEKIKWLKNVVLNALRYSFLPLEDLNEFLFYASELDFNQLMEVSLKTRPNLWLCQTFSNLICNALKMEKEEDLHQKSDLEERLFLMSLRDDLGGGLLGTLYWKVKKEGSSFALLLSLTKSLLAFEKLSDSRQYEMLPLKHWPQLLRHQFLSEKYGSSEVSDLILQMDTKIGQNKSDMFLEVYAKEKTVSKNLDLLKILQNFFKYQWISDSCCFDKETLLLLNSEQNIQEMIKNISQTDLSYVEILATLKRSENSLVDKHLVEIENQMVKILAKRKKGSHRLDSIESDMKTWVQKIKSAEEPVDIADFLDMASFVVHHLKGFFPRDSQLIAILIFNCLFEEQKGSIGQISTGEGKTLISSLLAIYASLRGNLVDIITSSTVLAEANIVEVQDIYKMFEVSVGNNCDEKCISDEKERRSRYANQVIYGDLSSFQRDLLMSKFFAKDISMNRSTGLVIVDEVDSMLLDKGENVFYLSHPIPEFNFLLSLFCHIWSVVHAPGLYFGTDKDVELVLRSTKEFLKSKNLVPNFSNDFVQQHLKMLVKNAFRAKNFISQNDSYKIDDLYDGKGLQAVIMDKETGVEQIGMTWSDGVTQFIQLKHFLEWTSVSLKAIFMSNICYFQKFKGKIAGMTGTLGSSAECALLEEVFAVSFFRLPRFRKRLCTQDNPIIVNDSASLVRNVRIETERMMESERSTLIVCENIETVDEIVKNLKNCNMQMTIHSYRSSFDVEFQKKQKTTKLSPREVIVATNLAGRGTDLRIDEALEANGGLHVIIAFLPPNSRVEAQAEGRTARAGQRGSYQFIICQEGGNFGENNNPFAELNRLKNSREEIEQMRLQQIRSHGIKRIELEEKFFQRFFHEVRIPAEQHLVFLEKPGEERDYTFLQLGFLNTKWALWLDSVENLISDSSDEKVKKLETSFDEFKSSALKTSSSLGVQKFATSPAELMVLANHLVSRSSTQEANQCLDQITRQEPSFCEPAMIGKVILSLKETDSVDKKVWAKRELKKVVDLIDEKIENYARTAQIMEMTKQDKDPKAIQENKFSGQITDLIGLYQIHLSAIKSITGFGLARALAPLQNKEEIRKIFQLFQDNLVDLKPFRTSKKLHFENGSLRHRGKNVELFWMPDLEYCKEKVVKVITEKSKACSRTIKKTDLMDFVVSKEVIWDRLVACKLIDKCEESHSLEIHFDEKSELPKNLITDLQPVKQEETFTFCEEKRSEEWSFGDYIFNPFSSIKNLVMGDSGPGKRAFTISGSISSTLSNAKNFVFSKLGYLSGGKEEEETHEGLVKYLREHNGQTFPEVCPEELDYTTDQWKMINEKLVLAKVLTNVRKLSGNLTVLVDNHNHSLPGELKEFQDPILVWYKDKTLEERVELTSLPFHDSKDAAVDQIWKCLLGQSFIKDCSLRFPWGSKDEEVEEFKKKIKGSIEKMQNKGLQEINNEYHKTKDIETYIDELTKMVVSSAGQLKIFPTVTASSININEYFTTGHWPSALEVFKELGMEKVIILDKVPEKKSWFDWRAFAVSMIGLAQIAAGIAISYCSFGLASSLSAALIAEGLGDVMFAIQTGLTGTFSWEAYKSHKIWSLSITALTFGIGALFKFGAVAAQAGQALKLKSVLSVFWQAGKHILGACYQTAKSVLISMAVQKFLSKLKALIIEHIILKIKSNIFDTIFFNGVDKMRNLMNRIWCYMKESHKLGDVVKKVGLAVSKARDEARGSWFEEMASVANRVGQAMVKCFSEATSVLQQEAMKYSHGQSNIVTQVIDTTLLVVNWTKKAMKYINIVTKIKAVFEMITMAPIYISKICDHLTLKLQSLRESKSNKSEASKNEKVEVSEKDFETYKEQVVDQVKTEISDKILSTINTIWLQPKIERKLERVVAEAETKVSAAVSSFFKSQTRNIPGQSCEEDSSGPPAQDPTKFSNELNDPNANLSEEEGESLNKAKAQVGQAEYITDSNGNKTMVPANFEEHVNNIKEGAPVTFYDLQMTAELLGVPITIKDPEGKFPQTDQTGSVTIYPNNTPSDTPPIVLEGCVNENGSMHVVYNQGGKSSEGSSQRPDFCWYESIAQANGISPDEFHKSYTNYLETDERARILYNKGLKDICPGMQVGRKGKEQPGFKKSRKIEVDSNVSIIRDEHGRPSEYSCFITNDQIGTGTGTTPKSRAFAKQQGKPTDHAGHFQARREGGSGSDLNNIFPIDPNLNCGEVKKFENEGFYDLSESGSSNYTYFLKVLYPSETSTRPDVLLYRRDHYDGFIFMKTTSAIFANVPKDERAQIHENYKDQIADLKFSDGFGLGGPNNHKESEQAYFDGMRYFKEYELFEGRKNLDDIFD